MKRILLITLCVVAVMCALHDGVRAEIKVGNLRIYPEIGLQEMYRSNIYQTEGISWLPGTKVRSDYVTSVIPGLKLKYRFGGQHSFEAGYLGEWKNYAKYSKNNYWDHRAFGNLSLRFPGGLDVALEQRYVRTDEERSAVLDRARTYTDYISGASAGYRFADRWKAEVRYNRFDHNFDRSIDRMNNYVSDLYGATMFYRLSPRTSVFVEYQHIVKDFDQGTLYDSTADVAFAGIKFDPAGRLKGEFKAGYGWKDFDRHIFGRENKPKTWHLFSNLTYDISKYKSLGFQASREFLDDGDFNNASYYRTFLSATYQHYFTYKIGASATVGYEQDDYQDVRVEPVTGLVKKRSDDRWTFGVGVFYNIQKYLKARLDYAYITRDSNFLTYSFNENRVMFKVVLSTP